MSVLLFFAPIVAVVSGMAFDSPGWLRFVSALVLAAEGFRYTIGLMDHEEGSGVRQIGHFVIMIAGTVGLSMVFGEAQTEDFRIIVVISYCMAKALCWDRS